MADDDQDKQHEPSQKKLDDARRKGEIPRSQDLSGAIAYAAILLVSGMVLFKGFCRYVCPLGAVMAIGGLLRGRKWIARRAECGSPCQLCKVKCNYGAIRRSGEIQYSECFQCLDCVTIHNSSSRCVPLILASRQPHRRAAAK